MIRPEEFPPTILRSPSRLSSISPWGYHWQHLDHHPEYCWIPPSENIMDNTHDSLIMIIISSNFYYSKPGESYRNVNLKSCWLNDMRLVILKKGCWKCEYQYLTPNLTQTIIWVSNSPSQHITTANFHPSNVPFHVGHGRVWSANAEAPP